MRTAVWLSGLVILLTVAGVVRWMNLPQPAVVRSNVVPPKKGSFKVRSDLDWRNVPEAQLREYTSFCEDEGNQGKKGHVVTDIETLVAPGETVVTQGYEDTPGQFVFSSITPTIKTVEDGSTVVHVEAKSFRMGIGGEYKIILTGSGDIQHNSIYIFGSPSDGRDYNLVITAEADESSPLIKMRGSGSSAPFPKGRVKQNAGSR